MSERRLKFPFSGQWVLAVVLVGILVGLRIPADAFADTAAATKLVFLGNKNIAPVVYLENAAPSGVAVDIVKALAPHIPRAIELNVMDWAEAQTLVARGDADALIQINETEERKKIYDFSDKVDGGASFYFCLPQSFSSRPEQK